MGYKVIRSSVADGGRWSGEGATEREGGEGLRTTTSKTKTKQKRAEYVGDEGKLSV